MDTQLDSGELSVVVCGRFDKVDEESLRPDPETDDIISMLIDNIRRKELNPYVSVNFCNCGNAYENGPSLTVLPEQVRYLDVDQETIDRVVNRHVKSVVRGGTS